MLVGGLNVTVYGPLENDTCLFWLHGRTMDQDRMKNICTLIREHMEEVSVVTMDLPNHGSRLVDEKRNEGYPQNTMHHIDMLGMRIEAMSDVQVIKALMPLYGMVYDKFAIGGVSMGGHIALHASRFKWVKWCVGLLGALDQVQLMRNRQGDRNFSSLYEETLQEWNPVGSLGSQPILLACGLEDDLVSPSCNVLHDAFVNVTYKTYPVGHRVCKKMLLDMVDWMKMQQNALSNCVESPQVNK